MRPRRLELEGFAAFREHQPVDFTALSLFAITGPTGSGKTSVLDAISFALYGEVARIGRHGLGELVSHGKAEARILLEFSVNGSTYRVSRRLPRRGAQQGKLERLDGDAWVDAVERSGIKAVNAAVEDLVKLDFESFCKAVVLPQGEFARFLKGEPTERRRTLVALLGLSHYDRMAAVARQRANDLRIRGEQTRRIIVEQFADATHEALADANAALETAAAVAAAAGEALSAARTLDTRRTRLEHRVARAAELAGQSDLVARELRAERSACVQVEAEEQEAAAEREAALTSVTAAGEELAAAEAEVERVTERLGTREHLSRLHDASERLVELERRVTESEEALAQLAAREADATSKLAGAKEQLDHTAAAAADATDGETSARATRDDAKASHDEALRVLDAARTAKARSDDVDAALIAARADAADAAVAAQTASVGADASERAREALRREHSVAVLVAGLAPGDPCPVCKGPLDEHTAVNDDAGVRLARADEALVASRAKASAATSAAAEARAVVAGLERRAAECEASLREVLDVSAAEETADAAADALATCETAVVETQSARLAADEALAAAREHVARLSQQVEGIALERPALQEAARVALADRDGARELLRARFGDEIPADAGARLAADHEKVVGTEAAVAGARENEAAARKTQSAAEERVRDAAQGAVVMDMRLQQLRGRVEAVVDAAWQLHDEPALGALPEPARARDTRAEELAVWCDGAARRLDEISEAATRDARDTANELAALARKLDIDADADGTLASIERRERETREAQVRHDESAKLLAQRVRQREELEAEIASDQHHVAVLDVLATELRADHFVDFVIQETLDVLASHASRELLRISDGRYSLLSRDGHFEVVDHVNADETRSVKTLSGGETFMASLSLALALSKHVTELAGEGLGARLEAVFIDEGFGSLDAETLEEVIDALERLREDDLLVGVISHVSALAERISEGLEVRKAGTRSVVVQSP